LTGRLILSALLIGGIVLLVQGSIKSKRNAEGARRAVEATRGATDRGPVGVRVPPPNVRQRQ